MSADTVACEASLLFSSSQIHRSGVLGQADGQRLDTGRTMSLDKSSCKVTLLLSFGFGSN